MERLKICLLAFIIGTFLSLGSFAAATQSPHIKALKTSGFYLGGILGSSDTNYSISGFDNTKTGVKVENGTVHPTGFGIGGLVGYLINQYFGIEAGYIHFDDAKGSSLNYIGGPVGQSGHIKENAVDLMAKGILPISQAIALYLKLGAAYLFSDTKVDNLFSVDRNGVKPAGALGVAFNATKNFVVDASYTRIQSSGRLQSAELIGLGFYWFFA